MIYKNDGTRKPVYICKPGEKPYAGWGGKKS